MTTLAAIDAWAAGEHRLVQEAKAKLEQSLGALRAMVLPGVPENPQTIRNLLDDFERAEMGLSGDLVVLQSFYDAIGIEQHGWGEASDEELMVAARQAFGGVE